MSEQAKRSFDALGAPGRLGPTPRASMSSTLLVSPRDNTVVLSARPSAPHLPVGQTTHKQHPPATSLFVVRAEQ